MVKKERTPITEKLAGIVLFASDHTCCKCRVEGRTVQIHHIDEDPSNNDEGNLSVLCLECHNGTQMRGGFGRGLSPEEISRYRDDWLERVRKRRDEADALASAAMARANASPRRGTAAAIEWVPPVGLAPATPDREGLDDFIAILPELRRQAYIMMQARNAVTTLDTVAAYGALNDVLRAALVKLLSYYPDNHFAEAGPAAYVSAVVSASTHWHYLRTNTSGVGLSGSLVQVNTVIGVVRDLERMVEQTVGTLTGTDVREPDPFDEDWQARWRQDVPWE
jgi:hypothetical protein